MKASKTRKSLVTDAYYQKHGSELKNTIQAYNQNVSSVDLFGTSEYAVFHSIQTGITKHPLRYYQMDALFLLDYLYAHAQAELSLKSSLRSHKVKELIADLLDEIEDEKVAPFLGYEMATGSGKTMLMGASIYFLNRKYGINNFLIITPASTDIYQKTIRNFEIGNFESVWAADTPFTFNLISGDNYTQNLFFDASKDANIFVFNISKFGTNASNTEKTWENAVWQDPNGNSISIKQFLKDQKLVIITDEAHHAQTPVANKIIKNFHPLAVLEFTATAIENGLKQNKKNQNIVYKYDIKSFLEDGYGKLVRAVALASFRNQRRGSFNDNEKLKLITLMLIHLLKREAILLDPKSKSLKPISFIKVKEETSFTQKVFDYVKKDLSSDLDNLNIILTKVREQDLEITDLLVKLFESKYKGDIDLLRTAIQQVADTAIFYYGKSDKETERKFLNIRKNEVELVVYMQRLDEGIDIPNIFSMAVVNDSETDFKTSVKQIIGRGVRLNKDKREFDEDSDLLRASSEKLHIVCDQGKNFEDVITAIQQEFGLNNKYLSFDKTKVPVVNRAKSSLLQGKYVPHIKADFKAKEGVSLMELIKDIDTITSNFLEANCFEGEDDTTKRFIKYRLEGFFLEVDVFADKAVYHKQLQDFGGKRTSLQLSESDTRAIYGTVLRSLYCLPDTDTTKKAFQLYVDRFNEIGLQYYRRDSADDKLASNLFVSAFSFFYRNHIEKNYFRLDFKRLTQEDSWNLKQQFKDYALKLPTDQVENKARLKIKDKARLLDLIDSQYHFYGYDKSAYDYDKFSSFPEFQFAEYVDKVLLKLATEKRPFWIRNQRNIWFTYGSKRYFPDFIMFKDDMIYVVETKGELFSDTRKNALLSRLEEIPGDEGIKGFKGLLVFSTQLDRMGADVWDFDRFIMESEDTIRRMQSKSDLVLDAPTEDRFVKYIPVYSPEAARKKFIMRHKTPKPDGWLEVEPIDGKYPETVFATQVKGSALLPTYDHDQWIILNHVADVSQVVSNIALVAHKSIDDGYDGHCTIRIVKVEQSNTRNRLFAENRIRLEAVAANAEPILIADDNIDIIGVILTR